MNKKGLILLSILSIAIVAGGVFIVKANNAKELEEILEEIKVDYGNIANVIVTSGIVQPQNRLEVVPSIGGRIEKILVNEGDFVKKGDILAWMSSADRAALLDAARAKGEEELEYWQDVYKETPLIAPIDGEVIVRGVEPGQTVSVSTPVLVLSNRLIVQAQVDESDIGGVKVGQEASIRLDAYSAISVKGTINHISYESRTVSNVTIYEVDILPEKVPSFFRSGMSANVSISQSGRENVLIVPLEAIKREKEGNFVLVSSPDEQEPLMRKVELGLQDDNNAEIVSGLDDHEKIVLKRKKFWNPNKPTGRNPFMPFSSSKKKKK